MRKDALKAPPPVPADNFDAVASARTLNERMPDVVTTSVAVFGISKSRTAPVFLPFNELLISFNESVAGVMTAVGVAAVPAFVSAAFTPRAVKLVSTDLISPLPDAIVMVTSPVVPSACRATAVGASPLCCGGCCCPPAGAEVVEILTNFVAPSTEKYKPSEPATAMTPVSQSTLRSLYVPVVVPVAACAGAVLTEVIL